MTRNAIKNVNMTPEKPNKIKAYFMKAEEEDMREFRKEIDLLFQKYQEKEKLEAKCCAESNAFLLLSSSSIALLWIRFIISISSDMR